MYLEIIFKLQLVYQDFQKYYETVLSNLQDEKSYMNSVESMKVDMINELQTQVQFFNEHIIESICHLV